MKIDRKHASEATIQAELYMTLKGAGYLPMLEQNFLISGNTRKGRQRKIRVDVIVAKEDGTAIAAIEVKADRFNLGPRVVSSGRQFEKYKDLGLPFKFCTCLEHIPEMLEWLSQQA